jgi:serine/threonine-protein kinase
LGCLREIETTAKLQHPHILGLIDSGEVNGTAYYVMPFVEGESLRDRLTREKQLSIPDAVRIATEVASALDYAHRHNVIHRDIKPENILLHDGSALVADFGIALAVSSAGGSRMTETGMSLGTPTYMSPEQAMGQREITARSDIYALGAMTYEMLTGEPPFSGPTAQAIVAKVLTEEPRPLIPRRHTIPPDVEEAVLTALEKLPADRFDSVAEFARAIGGDGKGLRSPGKRRPVPAPRPSRQLYLALALGSVALLAAGFYAVRAGARVIHPSRDSVSPPRSPGIWLEIEPALSPDGKYLAYAAGNTTSLRIYVRQVNGGRPIPLTRIRWRCRPIRPGRGRLPHSVPFQRRGIQRTFRRRRPDRRCALHRDCRSSPRSCRPMDRLSDMPQGTRSICAMRRGPAGLWPEWRRPRCASGLPRRTIGPVRPGIPSTHGSARSSATCRPAG